MENKLGDIVKTSLGRARVELVAEDEGDRACSRCILSPIKDCEGFACTSAFRKDNLEVVFVSISNNLQNIQNKIADLYHEIENLKIEFRKEFESREMDLVEQFHEEFPDIVIDEIHLSDTYIYAKSSGEINYHFKDNHWQKI